MSANYTIDEIRDAWEAGFALARVYGDNYFHWSGEQKERTWAKFLESRGIKPAPTPHRITSSSEIRKMLGDVKLGNLGVEEAFASIDLTMRCPAIDLAEWIEKKAVELRATIK